MSAADFQRDPQWEQHYKTAFHKLTGLLPTQENIITAYRLRDALGADLADAIWGVFLGLQFHLQLYQQIPAEIVSAYNEIVAATERSGSPVGNADAEARFAALTERAKGLVTMLEGSVRDVTEASNALRHERAQQNAAPKRAEEAPRNAVAAERARWVGYAVSFFVGVVLTAVLLTTYAHSAQPVPVNQAAARHR